MSRIFLHTKFSRKLRMENDMTKQILFIFIAVLSVSYADTVKFSALVVDVG